MVSDTRAMVRMNWFNWKSLCVSIADADVDVDADFDDFGRVVAALDVEVEAGLAVAAVVAVEDEGDEDEGDEGEEEALEG